MREYCRALSEELTNDMLIGRGRYRVAHRIDDLIVKTIRPTIDVKTRFGPADVPTKMYILCKFGVVDFNRFEQTQYERFKESIPYELSGNLAPILWSGKYMGESKSISRAVVDEDGSLSQTLGDYGPISSPDFWNQVKFLEHAMLEGGEILLDMHRDNLLVQQQKGDLIPVLFDYKRVGARSYPTKPWLWNEERQKDVCRRKFRKLYDQYDES